MSYLETKFKNYREIAPYDLVTNNFIRECDDSLSDIDTYIKCENGIRIYHYGGNILEAYIPSLGKGRNIIKAIYRDNMNKDNTEFINKEIIKKDGTTYIRESINIIDCKLYKSELGSLSSNNLIFDISESDEEVSFKFKTPNMEILKKYLNPITSGANISAHSVKNLPKNKTFSIPDEHLNAYKAITEKVPKESILKLGHITNSFISSLVTKKNPIENIKADMRKVMLKGKDYIYYLGEDTWNKYLKYLDKEISNL